MNTPDKTKQLRSSVKLLNNKLLFSGSVYGNEPIMIDYIPPHGDGAGYTSLELLLLSLTSCLGSAVLTLLRRTNKEILNCEIDAEGYRRLSHPMGFESIEIGIKIQSNDVTDADMQKVLKLSEETLCPVWAMLKGNVKIDVKYTIE